MSDSETTRRKGAVALGYNPEKDLAPKMIAKGYGQVAEKIIEIGRANGIVVTEDKALFEALVKLESGDEIPGTLYYTVAEVLSYVYRINKMMDRKK
jgi:flagellar biosynthesis protein